MMDTDKLNILKAQREKLYIRLKAIRREITELELAEYDFRGKYIYYPDRGYMYVDIQKKDDFENTLWFHGYGFNISVSEYRDDFYMFSDAMMDWHIPLDTFEREVDTIKIITKEEFEETFKKQATEYIENYMGMLERTIKTHKDLENEKD